MHSRAAILLSALSLAACEGPAYEEPLPSSERATEEQRFSSNQATLLIFELSGEVEAPGPVWSSRAAIDEQMLYTIGHLNWDRSVGRLDTLKLTDVQVTPSGGNSRITYKARLEVAWASKTNLPTAYVFTLPKKTGAVALDAFTQKYVGTCVDFAAHDVDAGNMWYYYRPQRSGCTLADEDVVKVAATVSTSTENTSGKYPEFHKVWEDNALEVVAIFGKYEDGATTPDDAGIAAYNQFVARAKTTLSGLALTTTPATVPASPGVETPDVTFEATLADGKRVRMVALLVDNVRTAPQSFYARYEALTPTADVIVYNGHAGLGSNVRALAREGRFVAGKYLLMFMNGCDTFAYVDGYMAQTRAALNPDDPTGTRYLDIVTNAMPAFFHSTPNASMTLIKALMGHATPVTFEKMFGGIDTKQVVVVTGEEDNVYFPGYPTGGGGGGGGGGTGTLDLKTSGVVAKGQELRYETALLAPGRYRIVLSPDPALPGGDADLYVRAGQAPTTSLWDCRPYLNGSAEECVMNLSTPATLHVLVRGWASSSGFQLNGASL